MSDRRERSAEEREAARRERDARRARQGKAPTGEWDLGAAAPAPAGDEPAAAAPEPASAPDPGPHPAPELRPEPLTGEPEPLAGEHEPLAGEHEPLAGEPEPLAGEHEPLAGEHEPLTGEHELVTGEHELVTGEHEPVTRVHPDEEPAGIRRVSGLPAWPSELPRGRRDRRDRRRDGHERRQRRLRREQATGAGHGRGRRIVGRAIAGIAAALVLAVVVFAVEIFQPFHGAAGGPVTVVIPAKATSSQVGDILARDGVVSSSFFFGLRATLAGDRGKLLAGTYAMRRGMSYGDALTVLTTPPPPIPVTELTISEGRTRRQIDRLLRSQGIPGSYLAASKSSPQLDPRAYGARSGAGGLEGFLFPSTYQLRKPVDIRALVAKQLEGFKVTWRNLDLRYARSKHLTAYDVLTIASIIEKEAATAHDRPLVASVIYNRLHFHMPLGMDSTTRYQFDDYTHPLTQSQLASPSPYNTRLHAGLPPTPIGNPGAAAIAAAAHPPNTRYLYFVVKPCGNGASAFSSSYAQFQRDVARYQSARARRGGRSPTAC